MVLVRIVFHAKLGYAGRFAAEMKRGIETMRGMPGPMPRHVRILTDLSGQFDTVVEEIEFDTLDDFMKGQELMFANREWQEMFKESSTYLLGGSKEYYTVEYEE